VRARSSSPRGIGSKYREQRQRPYVDALVYILSDLAAGTDNTGINKQWELEVMNATGQRMGDSVIE